MTTTPDTAPGAAAATPAGVRGRAPKTSGAPHGRAQVVPAVVRAATELFATNGVGGISVREIARQAGVNPALIPRYVGDKDDIVTAVLVDLSKRVVEQIDHYVVESVADPQRLPEPPPTMELYFRIATHLVVEGYDLDRHQPDFPVVRRVVELIGLQHGVDAAEARRRGAQVFVLALGIELFGSMLMHAAELDPNDVEVQATLRHAVHELSEAIASGQTAPRPP